MEISLYKSSFTYAHYKITFVRKPQEINFSDSQTGEGYFFQSEFISEEVFGQIHASFHEEETDFIFFSQDILPHKL